VPVFRRRPQPPTPRKDYAIYRPEVREDFTECCAYCLFPELLAGGKENFELDHFHPKSKHDEFDGDVNDFYNLYYSCHVCNHQKGAQWPAPQVLSSGCRFIDLCKEDFSVHFRAESDGHWEPRTTAANWAAERLLLNRGHLVQIRALLNQIASIAGHQPVDWNKPARDQICGILPNGLPGITPNGE
jgi:hypothetical protein